MDCWGIIPVKPFRAGKSRLAGLLGVDDLAALNRRLFGRVLTATLAVLKPVRVIVVTADPLLLPLMRGQGLHAVEDSGGGLNAALDLACRHAAARARGPSRCCRAISPASRPMTSRLWSPTSGLHHVA